jgi:hypothetical protein
MTGYAQPLPHALRGEMEGAGCSSALKFAGVHSVIGGIALPKDARVRLHAKFGFNFNRPRNAQNGWGHQSVGGDQSLVIDRLVTLRRHP